MFNPVSNSSIISQTKSIIILKTSASCSFLPHFSDRCFPLPPLLHHPLFLPSAMQQKQKWSEGESPVGVIGSGCPLQPASQRPKVDRANEPEHQHCVPGRITPEKQSCRRPAQTEINESTGWGQLVIYKREQCDVINWFHGQQCHSLQTCVCHQ